MSKIQVMNSSLANQIAAGEVVERPASVVKELIENAVDAKSTQIDIKVEESGLKSIQVIDNGEGIPSDEVISAFKRHATSKLLSEEDLFRIRTLGFRGEALPSIASVSEVLIESSIGHVTGKRVKLKGGEIQEETSAPSRKGTSIRIENLFFNTPARLKYVKSLQTELSHITDTVNRLALAHPEIRFSLAHDGNVLLKTPGNGDLRQAIAGIYGVASAKKMQSIDKENFDFKVSGYVSLPELNRSSNAYISLIINGRYIKNYALNKAIVKGYGSKLMVGRYPIAVVCIEMDPLLLDVNVHPTKKEIRISNERDLEKLVSEAIQERMRKESRIPDALENMNSGSKQKEKEVEQTKIQFSSFDTAENDFSDPSKKDNSNESNPSVDLKQDIHLTGKYVNESSEEKIKYSDQSDPEEYVELHVEESPLQTAKKVEKESINEKIFPELEYIGQMHGTYLLAQNEEGLFIIDQHAAQERIKYEEYRSIIDQSGTALQDLLVPIVLDYPSSEAIIIREKKEVLEKASVFLEEFGQNSFIVRTHPTWIKQGQEESTIREMIDFLLVEKNLSVKTFREATAIMMSCKRSIKANHYLSAEEARNLLYDLSLTENPYNCPHGRPVLVKLTNTQMEKMFKRIQDPH